MILILSLCDIRHWFSVVSQSIIKRREFAIRSCPPPAYLSKEVPLDNI